MADISLKSEFLDFMIQSNALLFGEFTLKSGRISPYFMNAGEMFKNGSTLAKLGGFYARLIKQSTDNFDANVLFGPAYKGIPLAAAAAIRLQESGIVLNITYDRKERKTHGESSSILGYVPQEGDKIAIIEDVTTAGTSIRDTFELFKALGNKAKFVSLYVSVDRMEKGTGNISAIEEIRQTFGIDVYSIVSTADIIDYLEDSNNTIPNAKTHADNIREYLKKYGA